MTAFFLTLSPSLSKTLSLSCLFSKALSKLKADSFRCPFYLLLFYCSLFVLFFFWLFSLYLLLIKAFACCHFTCLSLPLFLSSSCSLALFLLLLLCSCCQTFPWSTLNRKLQKMQFILTIIQLNLEKDFVNLY